MDYIIKKNNLWETTPEIAKLLKNPEDGYIVTKSSKDKKVFICPYCGKELNKNVSNVTHFGLYCDF